MSTLCAAVESTSSTNETRNVGFNSLDSQNSSHDEFQRHGNPNDGIEIEIAKKNYLSNDKAIADEENQVGPIVPIGFAGKVLKEAQFDDFIIGNENDIVDSNSNNVVIVQQEGTRSMQGDTPENKVANHHMQLTETKQGSQQGGQNNSSDGCFGNDVLCVFEDSNTTVDKNKKVTVTLFAIAPLSMKIVIIPV